MSLREQLQDSLSVEIKRLKDENDMLRRRADFDVRRDDIIKQYQPLRQISITEAIKLLQELDQDYLETATEIEPERT